MFEHFTSKAVLAIMLAQEEARRHQYNHVGSEQMLLGLIGVGSGIASQALKRAGVNLSEARNEVKRLTGAKSERVGTEIPFTASAKTSLENAWDAARELGHNYIATEHLLLGLLWGDLEDQNNRAFKVLEHFKVDLSKLKEEVKKLAQQRGASSDQGGLVLRTDDVPSASENEIIDATVKYFIRRQNQSYKPGQTARRALHGKSLGTVKAKFIVPALPAALQKGIFEHPGTYDAILRFSNGSLSPKTPDLLPNVRGLALKIYNVDQPNLLAEEGLETGHELECDFLFVNSPTFFLRDIGFIDAIMKKDFVRIVTYLPDLVSNLVPATNQLVPSLLTANFYTQVPHWFGDEPCKYALLAQSSASSAPSYFETDYLRRGLERDLSKAQATFNFCVQFKQPQEKMNVLTQKWTGEFLTLATLEIEQRSAPILESDGEVLSFNPCRTPSAHGPAGWVGRMRKAVYKADFDWRAQKNAVS